MERISIACSGCGAKLKVAATAVGKRVSCPKCRTALRVEPPASMEPLHDDLEVVEEEGPSPPSNRNFAETPYDDLEEVREQRQPPPGHSSTE